MIFFSHDTFVGIVVSTGSSITSYFFDIVDFLALAITKSLYALWLSMTRYKITPQRAFLSYNRSELMYLYNLFWNQYSRIESMLRYYFSKRSTFRYLFSDKCMFAYLTLSYSIIWYFSYYSITWYSFLEHTNTIRNACIICIKVPTWHVF